MGMAANEFESLSHCGEETSKIRTRCRLPEPVPALTCTRRYSASKRLVVYAWYASVGGNWSSCCGH